MLLQLYHQATIDLALRVNGASDWEVIGNGSVYFSITKIVFQMSQKGSGDIFHIFESQIVRSKSAHQTMPWSYHSLSRIEFGKDIILASSFRSIPHL